MLPGELRQQIWDLATSPEQGLYMKLFDGAIKTSRQTCHQIRSECVLPEHFWSASEVHVITRQLDDPPLEDSRILARGDYKLSYPIQPVFDALGKKLDRRPKRAVLHLGTWDVESPRALETLKDLTCRRAFANLIGGISAALLVRPMIAFDLVWGRGQDRWSWGRLTIPMCDREQALAVHRETMRVQRQKMGWEGVGHIGMNDCSKALLYFINRVACEKDFSKLM